MFKALASKVVSSFLFARSYFSRNNHVLFFVFNISKKKSFEIVQQRSNTSITGGRPRQSRVHPSVIGVPQLPLALPQSSAFLDLTGDMTAGKEYRCSLLRHMYRYACSGFTVSMADGILINRIPS